MATRPGKDHIVGVDIGGTGIKGALVDVKAGKLAARRAHLSTPHPATPAAVAETVGEILKQIDSDGPVGLTLPTVVARRYGRDGSQYPRLVDGGRRRRPVLAGHRPARGRRKRRRSSRPSS